ncbi:glycerate kinase, partial [Georgenia subflava]
MHILLAPDRFTGNLTAVQAAASLADGWHAGAPDDTVTQLPLSDGSGGLLDVVAAARGGELVTVAAPGPLGETGPAAVLHVPGTAGGTAYVETGQVIGAHLVRGQDRARAAGTGTSAGVGHLLTAARATGARRIVVGLAGTSAVHDGGTGLLAALAEQAGATVPGDVLGGGAAGLGALAPADVEVLDAVRAWLEDLDVVLAVADDLPLLGLHGAGALLGNDPAVGPVLAQELERALGHATDLLEQRAAVLPAPRAGLSLSGAGGAGHSH